MMSSWVLLACALANVVDLEYLLRGLADRLVRSRNLEESIAQSEIAVCGEQVLTAMPWLVDAEEKACREASYEWIRVSGLRWRWMDGSASGDLTCWIGGHSAELCCDETFGPSGNPECWDAEYTYQRCCGSWLSRTESFDVLPERRRTGAAFDVCVPRCRWVEVKWVAVPLLIAAPFVTSVLAAPVLALASGIAGIPEGWLLLVKNAPARP